MEVPDPLCPCYNWPNIKETALHHFHCTYLSIMWSFKDNMDSLQKLIKYQDTEQTMIWVRLFWYMKVEGRKLCQDDPYLPMELYSPGKAQYNIEWYNVIWVCIARHWN